VTAAHCRPAAPGARSGSGTSAQGSWRFARSSSEGAARLHRDGRIVDQPRTQRGTYETTLARREARSVPLEEEGAPPPTARASSPRAGRRRNPATARPPPPAVAPSPTGGETGSATSEGALLVLEWFAEGRQRLAQDEEDGGLLVVEPLHQRNTPPSALGSGPREIGSKATTRERTPVSRPAGRPRARSSRPRSAPPRVFPFPAIRRRSNHAAASHDACSICNHPLARFAAQSLCGR